MLSTTRLKSIRLPPYRAPFQSQELDEALKGLIFTPDLDSNILNTADLASVTITVDDLGHSGGGGGKKSEPLTLRIVVTAENDRPVLDLPSAVAAEEDVPVRMSMLQVSDVDVGEPGGGGCRIRQVYQQRSGQQ